MTTRVDSSPAADRQPGFDPERVVRIAQEQDEEERQRRRASLQAALDAREEFKGRDPWQQLPESDARVYTYRMQVPGGWLFMVTEAPCNENPALQFVPEHPAKPVQVWLD